jgi:hypothetical protein
MDVLPGCSTNWVQCERCQKWRRITNEYADTVDDEVEWWVPAWQEHHPAGALLWTHTHPATPCDRSCRYCELNPDKQFANCNIPQELTDEQIDQEAAELAEVREATAVACCGCRVHAAAMRQACVMVVSLALTQDLAADLLPCPSACTDTVAGLLPAPALVCVVSAAVCPGWRLSAGHPGP